MVTFEFVFHILLSAASLAAVADDNRFFLNEGNGKRVHNLNMVVLVLNDIDI